MAMLSILILCGVVGLGETPESQAFLNKFKKSKDVEVLIGLECPVTFQSDTLGILKNMESPDGLEYLVPDGMRLIVKDISFRYVADENPGDYPTGARVSMALISSGILIAVGTVDIAVVANAPDVGRFGRRVLWFVDEGGNIACSFNRNFSGTTEGARGYLTGELVPMPSP